MSRQNDRFYYHSVMGTTIEIKLGERYESDGKPVTQELLDFLIEDELEKKGKADYREQKETVFDEDYEKKIGVYDEYAFDEQERELDSREELIRRCVDRLSPKQQELYFKRMGMKMTFESIAEEQGISRQAVYTQMKRLEKKLKELYEELNK